MSTRVKICGITRVEDAETAAKAGADAIGLVFYSRSARCIDDLLKAADVALAAGPLVTKVALFVDAEPKTIEGVLSQVPINLLQFHGGESALDCERYGCPYIKAIRMRENIEPLTEMAKFPSAEGFLLDSFVAGVPGGTGARFDWARVPTQATRPIILAGGLTPANIELAISQTRPYAVDVSGGVEISPGVKSGEKIVQFISKAKNQGLNLESQH